MSKIIITNLNNKIVPVCDSNKPLLYQFHHHYLDWMHACGGKGKCTTCKVIVEEGLENFGPITQAEEKYFEKGLLKSGERLACQACIRGDIKISVPDENKLPHINYSN